MTVINIGGSYFELLDDQAVEVARILAGATPVRSLYNNGGYEAANRIEVSIDFTATVRSQEEASE